MRVRPNQTTLRGRVAAVTPEKEGRGAEVDLEVLENETASPDDDFLRPDKGTVLKAFWARPEALNVGDVVRVQASLSAGPFGGRAVLNSVEQAGAPSAAAPSGPSTTPSPSASRSRPSKRSAKGKRPSSR